MRKFLAWFSSLFAGGRPAGWISAEAFMPLPDWAQPDPEPLDMAEFKRLVHEGLRRRRRYFS